MRLQEGTKMARSESRRVVMKRGWMVAAVALVLAGCTPDFVTQDESEAILRIVGMTGVGQSAGSGDNALNSDVVPVFDDQVEMTVQAIPKNPALLQPGAFQDVRIERYEVSYIRSDGRGVEGVDVPFRITGNITQLVPFGSQATVVIDVVRHQAKLEPPLINLAGQGTQLDPSGAPVFGGGALVLTCFADVTLHGRTTTGAALTASGRMQINFADFQD
jgi:hypothetical protein